MPTGYENKLGQRSQLVYISGVPQEFCSGVGVRQIQLRTEDRVNGDLGAVAP